MLRLLDVLLFAAPFAAWLAWRHIAARGTVPTALPVLALLTVLLLGAGLAWFGAHRGAAPHATYVPAALRNGRVEPGHAARS